MSCRELSADARCWKVIVQIDKRYLIRVVQRSSNGDAMRFRDTVVSGLLVEISKLFWYLCPTNLTSTAQGLFKMGSAQFRNSHTPGGSKNVCGPVSILLERRCLWRQAKNPTSPSKVRAWRTAEWGSRMLVSSARCEIWTSPALTSGSLDRLSPS